MLLSAVGLGVIIRVARVLGCPRLVSVVVGEEPTGMTLRPSLGGAKDTMAHEIEDNCSTPSPAETRNCF
jgi:hypothetical protein